MSYWSNNWSQKMGNPDEIDIRVPYKNLRLHRRQPVGCVKSAAPGYHYTRDHLLPLEPPRKWSGNHPTIAGL